MVGSSVGTEDTLDGPPSHLPHLPRATAAAGPRRLHLHQLRDRVGPRHLWLLRSALPHASRDHGLDLPVVRRRQRDPGVRRALDGTCAGAAPTGAPAPARRAAAPGSSGRGPMFAIVAGVVVLSWWSGPSSSGTRAARPPLARATRHQPSADALTLMCTAWTADMPLRVDSVTRAEDRCAPPPRRSPSRGTRRLRRRRRAFADALDQLATALRLARGDRRRRIQQVGEARRRPAVLIARVEGRRRGGGRSVQSSQRPPKRRLRFWKSRIASNRCLAVEVRPEHRREPELRVGGLPQQEVGGALLAAGADQQVGVGHVGVVEAARDLLLVDLLDPRSAPRRGRAISCFTASSDLGAPAVVEGDREGHAGVVAR